MKAYKKIKSLKDIHWKRIKSEQISQIIEACAGLYLEASAQSASSVPNENITINIEVLNRNSEVPVYLESMSFETSNLQKIKTDVQLLGNQKQEFNKIIKLNNLDYTDPYWLQSKGTLGMYQVSDNQLIGKQIGRAHV